MAKKSPRRWADIKAQHRNARRDVTLVMDTASALEAKRLAAELGDVAPADAAALARRVRELEDAAAASAVRFVFEGIGRARQAKLLAEHPPTAEQREQAPEGMTPRYDLETYPPLLMALSCVEPAELHTDLGPDGEVVDQAVVDEWTEIYHEWSDGQTSELWRACGLANAAVNAAPKSPVVSAVLGNSASR